MMRNERNQGAAILQFSGDSHFRIQKLTVEVFGLISLPVHYTLKCTNHNDLQTKFIRLERILKKKYP